MSVSNIRSGITMSNSQRELGCSTPIIRKKSSSSMHDLSPRTTSAATGMMQFIVNGIPSEVSIDSDGLRWMQISESKKKSSSSSGLPLVDYCLPILSPAHVTASHRVPYAEMVSVERIQHTAAASTSLFDFGQKLTTANFAISIYTFQRPFPSTPNDWQPWTLRIESSNEEEVERLLSDISSGITAASSARPQHLLILINPNAGSGGAPTLYHSTIHPLFSQAGITTQIVVTEHSGHAAEIVQHELAGEEENQTAENIKCDGIVAVGGDGVFHEVLNGLLTANLPPKMEDRIRISHIPCGSTDAVAFSLNGSRSAFTAAMRVVLGDSTPLDALKVSIKSSDGSTTTSSSSITAELFSCTMASYGFMADVVAGSEQYRFLGPLRYDAVGALKVVANQSYRCRVSYLSPPTPPPSPSPSAPLENTTPSEEEDEEKGSEGGQEGGSGEEMNVVCTTNCEVCKRAASVASLSQLDITNNNNNNGNGSSSSPSSEDAGTSAWKVVEGEWMAIMLICQTNRSDKTLFGMVKHGHLSNGQCTLVLVHKCSPLQYVRFLMSMSSKGMTPGMFPGVVEVLDVVSCKVEPVAGDGPVSCWNVDGELIAGMDLEAHMQLGAVQCFARGVEKWRTKE